MQPEHRGAYRAFVGAVVVFVACGVWLLAAALVYVDSEDGHKRRGVLEDAAWALVVPGHDDAKNSGGDAMEQATRVGFVAGAVCAGACVVGLVSYRGFCEDRLVRYHARTLRLAARGRRP